MMYHFLPSPPKMLRRGLFDRNMRPSTLLAVNARPDRWNPSKGPWRAVRAAFNIFTPQST